MLSLYRTRSLHIHGDRRTLPYATQKLGFYTKWRDYRQRIVFDDTLYLCPFIVPLECDSFIRLLFNIFFSVSFSLEPYRLVSCFGTIITAARNMWCWPLGIREAAGNRCDTCHFYSCCSQEGSPLFKNRAGMTTHRWH